MAFNDLRAATAVLALLAASVAPVSAQTPAPPPAPEASQAQPVLQTPAQPEEADEAPVGDMQPAGADVDEEDAEPALSPAEIAAETKQCKDNRRRALKLCVGVDFECRASAMKRHQNCLARLQQK